MFLQEKLNKSENISGMVFTTSYSFALILYTYFYNANVLSIAISIMMFFSIVAATYLQKTETYLKLKR